jgi:hypothetical protein
MKKFLWASAAGILIGLPSLSKASVLTFEISGSQYELLFNPQGSGGCDLPSSCYYRSYNCVIGQKPVYPTIVFTPPPPPKGNNTPPGGNKPGNPGPPNNPPSNPPSNPTNGDVNPPGPPDNGPTTPTNPGGDMGGGGCDPASVPAPNSAAMAGAGIAAMGLFRWFRSRRQARA